MSTKIFLCIGGPKAGHKVALDGQYLRVAVRPPLSVSGNVPEHDDEPVSSKTVMYVRQRWRWSSDEEDDPIEVLAPEGQTPRATMELLLETYELHGKRR